MTKATKMMVSMMEMETTAIPMMMVTDRELAKDDSRDSSKNVIN